MKSEIGNTRITEYLHIKDESLNIDWHIPVDKAILSEKDLKHACLKDFDSPFSIDMSLH